MSNVTIKLPYDLKSIIGEHKNIEKESRILIATELYREGEISAGKAAELANLPFEDFIEELKNRKMKIYSLLGVSEIEEEKVCSGVSALIGAGTGRWWEDEIE